MTGDLIAIAVDSIWWYLTSWHTVLPFEPWVLGVLLFVPALIIYLHLTLTPYIRRLIDLNTPGEYSLREQIASVARSFSESVRGRALAVYGAQARRVADAIESGKWVVLMDDVKRDERHSPGSSLVELKRDESILFSGATEAGKTTTISGILDQQQFDDETAVIAYDYKEDWYEYFSERDDVNVLRLSPNPERCSVLWNIFEELESEEGALELAEGLTKDLDGGDFFSQAGTQLLEGVMRVKIREQIPDGVDPDDPVRWLQQDDVPLHLPSNRDLVEYLQTHTPEEIWGDLSEHDDLAGVAGYIDPESKKQAVGVIASMQVSVRKMFSREFGRAGSFSIREYMADPSGYVLVLDLPERQKEVTKPVYRMLLDRAAAHANSRNESAVFLLDEFASLPELHAMDRLVNAGRSYNTQVITAVQSVSQVMHTYGREQGQAILEGHTQQVLLRSEGETREYVQDVLGSDVREKTEPVLNDGERVGSGVKKVEEPPFSKREIGKFGDDESVDGVVKLSDGTWVYGTVMHPDEVSEVVGEALEVLE